MQSTPLIPLLKFHCWNIHTHTDTIQLWCLSTIKEKFHIFSLWFHTRQILATPTLASNRTDQYFYLSQLHWYKSLWLLIGNDYSMESKIIPNYLLVLILYISIPKYSWYVEFKRNRHCWMLSTLYTGFIVFATIYWTILLSISINFVWEEEYLLRLCAVSSCSVLCLHALSSVLSLPLF